MPFFVTRAARPEKRLGLSKEREFGFARFRPCLPSSRLVHNKSPDECQRKRIQGTQYPFPVPSPLCEVEDDHRLLLVPDSRVRTGLLVRDRIELQERRRGHRNDPVLGRPADLVGVRRTPRIPAPTDESPNLTTVISKIEPEKHMGTVEIFPARLVHAAIGHQEMEVGGEGLSGR